MVKESNKQEMVPVSTFHYAIAKHEWVTYERHKDVVPEEHYAIAENKGVKLIPKIDVEKAIREEKSKSKIEEVKTSYTKEELKAMNKTELSDLMLARGFSRRDIQKKKDELVKQVLDTNPVQDKVKVPEDIKEEEKTK